ncbi:UNVERIFIED_CONTAM: hypothetical protein Slati_2759800 [Sesamum latifolium]|uniref:Uncharacterized protein n=1 Tax=Sesamum latifolium TaxID=2727402 RepID=A0AAW2VZB7_9LAMI
MAVSEGGASGASTVLVPKHECYEITITYWWDCDNECIFRVFHMSAEKYIRKTFFIARSSLVKPLWLANEIWLQLQTYWASEGFLQESSKNKTNRAANPTASSTLYRGGSSSVGMHKRKLEAELGRTFEQMEVFERCYKKKEDSWSGPRAAEVAASVAMTEQQMWLDAVGGKNKGCVFDLSSVAHFSSRTYTSPPPPPPPNPAQEDRIGNLEVMMADMMVMIREIRFSSSVAGPSQPAASSTTSAQPTINPQPPNDDEMGGLD